jgi:hypothetical protein
VRYISPWGRSWSVFGGESALDFLREIWEKWGGHDHDQAKRSSHPVECEQAGGSSQKWVKLTQGEWMAPTSWT